MPPAPAPPSIHWKFSPCCSLPRPPTSPLTHRPVPYLHSECYRCRTRTIHPYHTGTENRVLRLHTTPWTKRHSATSNPNALRTEVSDTYTECSFVSACMPGPPPPRPPPRPRPPPLPTLLLPDADADPQPLLPARGSHSQGASRVQGGYGSS